MSCDQGLRVEEYGGTPGEWDEFVRRCDGWTPCHLYGWKDLIERVFRHETSYLAAIAPNGSLAGVLPLVRIDSRLFGRFLVSMPFLNYGGPLGSGEAVPALTNRALQLAADRGSDLLELRSRFELSIDLAVSHRKITVLLELPAGDPSVLWKQLKAKVRSQVRRAMKEGMTVRFGVDQLEPFYSVFAENMRDLGTPPQSRRFFRTILDSFPAEVQFGCVYLGGRPVAAGCGFLGGSEFEMTWASSLRRFNSIAPNMQLYWSFMERCAEEGVATFNFGRCTPGGGTHRFKRQWGGSDAQLWWYNSGHGRDATPSAESGAYALGVAAWRRLPVAVSRRLGPMIVRYIP